MCAASFFDWVQLVAAGGALVEVFFALETVLESRALRREDRIDGLLESVLDGSDSVVIFPDGERSVDLAILLGGSLATRVGTNGGCVWLRPSRSTMGATCFDHALAAT